MQVTHFLSLDDEEKIKDKYDYFKSQNDIDIDLIPILDELNTINGLATLYSCQGHLDNPYSYLVLCVSEQIIYPLTEALWELIEESNIEVNWNEQTHYLLDNYRTFDTIILRGDMNYGYMQNLVDKLAD